MYLEPGGGGGVQIRDSGVHGKVPLPGPRGKPPLTTVRGRGRTRHRDGKVGGVDGEGIPTQTGSRAGDEVGGAQGEDQSRGRKVQPHGFRVRHVLGSVPAARQRWFAAPPPAREDPRVHQGWCPQGTYPYQSVWDRNNVVRHPGPEVV